MSLSTYISEVRPGRGRRVANLCGLARMCGGYLSVRLGIGAIDSRSWEQKVAYIFFRVWFARKRCAGSKRAIVGVFAAVLPHAISQRWAGEQ